MISDDLKDGAVSTKAKYSVDGHGGFTVTGKIKTDSKDVVLAEQKGAYKVGIDGEGYLTLIKQTTATQARRKELRLTVKSINSLL